jgi:hypothetical protein
LSRAFMAVVRSARSRSLSVGVAEDMQASLSPVALVVFPICPDLAVWQGELLVG